jgi:hypothetical protein
MSDHFLEFDAFGFSYLSKAYLLNLVIVFPPYLIDINP